jgi:hypothetical protein
MRLKVDPELFAITDRIPSIPTDFRPDFHEQSSDFEQRRGEHRSVPSKWVRGESRANRPLFRRKSRPGTDMIDLLDLESRRLGKGFPNLSSDSCLSRRHATRRRTRRKTPIGFRHHPPTISDGSRANLSPKSLPRTDLIDLLALARIAVRSKFPNRSPERRNPLSARPSRNCSGLTG